MTETLDPPFEIPRCKACGLRLTPMPHGPRGKDVTFENIPRGRQGDGFVCGIKCGYDLAMRLLAAEPQICSILPPKAQIDVIADARGLPASALRSRKRAARIAENKRQGKKFDTFERKWVRRIPK